MRLGTTSTDEFLRNLNKKNEEIQKLYLKKMTELTKTVTIRGMLGDSTVVEQKTFDPMRIQDFYKKVLEKMPEWSSEGISISNNEDLRRIFAKFNIKIGNYLISCHMSIQFHVLLYYKPNNKVIEYQKELSQIIDKTKNSETKLANESDQYILDKLKESGHEDLDYDELFQIFYKNDKLREKISKEIEQKSDVGTQGLIKRKKQLFNELDNLLMETYQTEPVLIDDSKLVTGEEGCLVTIDLQFLKNNIKEGRIDPKKISYNVKNELLRRLDEIIKVMRL